MRTAPRKSGVKRVTMEKHGVLQYMPVRPMKETKGMISGLDIEDLHDKTESM